MDSEKIVIIKEESKNNISNTYIIKTPKDYWIKKNSNTYIKIEIDNKKIKK